MNVILHLGKPTHGDKDFYDRWKEIGPVYKKNEKTKEGKAPEAKILITDHRTSINDSMLDDFPNVSFVCTPNTAHSHLFFNPAPRGIKIISLKGEREFLSQIKSVAYFVMSIIYHDLKPLTGFGKNPSGKTLSIIGKGRIGTHLMALAVGNGMNVITIDQQSKPRHWENAFKKADFVSLHLPEEESTHKLINRSYLDLMRKDSCLINTSRGSIIDEKYLAHLTSSGKIRRAYVDTVENEKILNENTPGVTVTPHAAGCSIEDRIKTDQFILEKLKKALPKKRVSNKELWIGA